MTAILGAPDAAAKRKRFAEGLKSGKLLRFPGAFSPHIAQIIEQIGFDGVYISGAGIANDLGYPDIGITTLTEVATRGRQIARATSLPALIDIDTGFGEAMSVARTVGELEELGLAGCHLEDQINPKRCGHLDNKGIVSVQDMVTKVRAAANAKKDKNFVIMARTDAAASEGLEAAIERAKAYVDAGADAIFPEAMRDEKDFAAFRKAIKVPLLANMTEFGKSRLFTTKELTDLGYNMVIYPMTSFRLAMGAVEAGYREIFSAGTQEGVVDRMQTRKRLYEIISYEDYNAFDQSIFNFSQKNHGG
ncbi:MAG TPA: methylisocitrate lyase [Bdellovibrionota bacterium]|jgi:methylisocitrate lyase|nr:methylisocitrate lyase [Bdellovibrionota bacterium]